jgi:MFS family permease
MRAVLRALKRRDFLLLWTGQTVSRIGDFAYEVIIAWWVLQETGSAAIMSSVLIVSFLPVALFTVVGGVLVDRQPRARVMVAADLARALLVLGMAYLAWSDQFSLWAVYVLGIVIGSIDAFFQPAAFALVPEIVPEEDLPSANALTSMSFQLGRVVGPPIGGLVTAIGGVTFGLLLNGASFLVGGLLLAPLLVGARAPERDDGAEAGWWPETRGGFQMVWRDPVLRLGVFANTLAAAMLVGPFMVALPFLAAERFGNDATAYGLLLAVFPVGFLLGSLWAGRQETLRRPGWLLFGGTAIGGLALALFGFPLPAAVIVAAALINGFGLEIATQAWTLIMQQRAPAERLGRLASISELGFWLLTPVSMAAAGFLADRFGAGVTFFFGGVGAAAVSLLALGSRVFWELQLGGEEVEAGG